LQFEILRFPNFILNLILTFVNDVFLLDVKRKLGFLDIPGYDIFGKNEMSAPRIKWEALADTVESIKDAAQTYETAFNDIIANVENKENFQEVCDPSVKRRPFTY